MDSSASLRLAEAPRSGLQPAQLAWLAAAVFVVSAGYGALMPLLPGWLRTFMADGDPGAMSRHVGYLSGIYAAGVLAGAPLWGVLADRLGRVRVLMGGLVGYVASLLPLLQPEWIGLPGIYMLRGATGFFVGAVVPIVPAVVAEHTPRSVRARRFAWLGAMSLLGFLLGPAFGAVADRLSGIGALIGMPAWSSMDLVIGLSAALGASVILGLAVTLPAKSANPTDEQVAADRAARRQSLALWILNGAVMFVLAGFELGIVLQGQQHPGLSPRDVSLMFAACGLVMLGVNALLFVTGLLERADSRGVLAAGMVLAVAGLGMMARHGNEAWMYVGVSLTAAGTGAVLATVPYLAAGGARRHLGAAMGGLAAAAGLGQTLGSAAAGWLFGAVAQISFAWLAMPLLLMLGVVLTRSEWRPPRPALIAPSSSAKSEP
ncbi:MAG: MFS transporter [Rubrivivax sp.]|nr:MFS transporter [Rubrivivax sp.]